MGKHDERNKGLAEQYISGKPMTTISSETGISCTQLSRIFRSLGVERKKFEVELDFFDNKTLTELSSESGISISRLRHLKSVLVNKVNKNKKASKSGSNKHHDLLDDKGWLYNKYVIEQVGASTIAVELDVKLYYIYKALKKHKIVIRNQSEANKILSSDVNVIDLINNYSSGWSIQKCAEYFNCSWDRIYDLLSNNGIKVRSASEQQQGELNPFFGKQHPDHIIEKCKECGRIGAEYWTTGDVESKKKMVSNNQNKYWNEEHRLEASIRTTEMCCNGMCNSKNIEYKVKSGLTVNLKSSWELKVAEFLDSLEHVKNWEYEKFVIPYYYEGWRNFIVDFVVNWADGLITLIECKNLHLLESDKEKAKIAAISEYCKETKDGLNNIKFILISNYHDLDKLIKPEVEWIIGNRYYVDKSYLKHSELAIHAMLHEINNRINGFISPSYFDEELEFDIEKMAEENVDKYCYDDMVKSTAGYSQYGIPGRRIMIHFHPHIYDVKCRKEKSISEAFNDKTLVFNRGLMKSYKENESLSFERLIREINYNSSYSRTSYFAPGFARYIIRRFSGSGGRVFDPCMGWGGRMMGAWLEGCRYIGCELSDLTFNGLCNLSKFLGFSAELHHGSCLDFEWPDCDLVFTSPPFYDIEKYIGGDQPHLVFGSREEWCRGFVGPFIEKLGRRRCALYLDRATVDDFQWYREFDEVIPVNNKRHARRKSGLEYLGVYYGGG